jgi:hypothetical protein
MPQDTRENKIEKFSGPLEKEDLGFTMLINATLQKITNVDALGIYCYLASKPPQWHINTLEIGRHFKIGRDKTRNALAYLVQIGALIPKEKREQGKITEKYYLLRLRLTEPELIPGPENPSLDIETPGPEKPGPENPSLYKTKREKTKKKSSTAETAAPPTNLLDLFEKYKISTPAKITNQTLSTLQQAVNHLASNGYTLQDYLIYLSDDCSNWLLPYEIDGRMKRNDFYVIMKTHIIDKAIRGDLENK